jgi:hypothetical protein
MEALVRWRLILGSDADPDNQVSVPRGGKGKSGNSGSETNEPQWQVIDELLDQLYSSTEKHGGLGQSIPKAHKWLSKLKQLFPRETVVTLQKDAFERYGMKQMLLDPDMLEEIVPDIHLAATLLSLKDMLPEKVREPARAIIRKLVAQIEDRLKMPIINQVQGSLSRHTWTRRPRAKDIHLDRTIRANLKHYQPSLQTIIPDRLIGFGRRGKKLHHVIILLDQSGSMTDSVIYGGIIGSILAAIGSLRTHVIAFDTEVVDLTEQIDDPVDLLFGLQLGGGTDIAQALAYARTLIVEPSQTHVFVVTDLYEGGDSKRMLVHFDGIKSAGAQVVCLLSLNDDGHPSFDKHVAQSLVNMGIPSFGCTPESFPGLLGSALEGQDLAGYQIEIRR